MIRVIGNKEKQRVKPYYYLAVLIEIGDCDAFDENRRTISDEEHPDKWNYISTEDAEHIYNFFKDISKDGYRINLEGMYQLSRYLESGENVDRYTSILDGKILHDYLKYKLDVSEEKIEELSTMYWKYGDIFNPPLEHEYCHMYGVAIYYCDEFGVTHECEVI